MIKPKALSGTKVGNWNVISMSEIKRNSLCYWNCLCDCGTVKMVAERSLTYKTSLSCGCSKKLHSGRKKEKDSFMSSVFARYKYDAKNRLIDFSLSKEQFKTLITGNCFYCESIPSNIHQRRSDSFKYSGIDRVDNQIGYIFDNCVSCCQKCNSDKKSVSKEIIIKAYLFLVKKVA